ncbi:ATP-grasp domain-containing protein [Heyndrickxia sporothermodurans]|uniref:ATP-binding protein n=1 Tax=Heyndrickxia sporothermodurans TaxID=46224 RepID=UPI002E23E65F|nr:ATP-grasp domain-containing protein [Heyndrickxia sporothermodurans]
MLDLDSRRAISGQVIKHIDNSLPDSASSLLNGYALALEGWRRGLDLSMKISYEMGLKSRNFRFTLSDRKGTSYDFNSAAPSVMSDEARRICRKKELTKKVFKEKGVPHAEGTHFSTDTSYDKIIEYANKLGYPIVIKPNDAYGGKGVITDIQNDQQLIESLKSTKHDMGRFSNIIVEKCYTGNDYRIYVIEDEVIASVQRVPANVTGDGKSTIIELINEKNKIRMNNKGPSNQKKIRIDGELKTTLLEKKLTLDTVLPEGKLVFLNKKCNVSSGGESIDVTDELNETYKQIAIDAVKAIDGLHLGAVDLLIDEQKGTAIVIEINTKPGLDIQMYPTFGKARDIPTKIIDYLFPDTINYNKVSSRKMFFDFDSVYEMTYQRSIFKTVELERIPSNIKLKKYVITMPIEKQDSFMGTIQRAAHRYKISGSLKRLSNRMILVMGGNSKNINLMLELINDNFAKYGGKCTLEEMVRTKPVRQGFDIIDMVNK